MAKYIGLSVTHVPGDAVPGKLWAEFSQRVGEIKNVSGPAVGIAGSFRADGTATYAAAREVSDASFVPAGMQVFTAPAGSYADFTVDGPISGLGRALDYIFGDWAPKHDCHENGASIEVYPDAGNVNAPDFKMHLLVLLKQ